MTNAQAFTNFTVTVSTDIDATSDGATPTTLTDILNTTLAANGGPTATHALVSGSPALDAVPLDGGGTGCRVTGDVLANGDALFGANNRVGGDAQAGRRIPSGPVAGSCRGAGRTALREMAARQW